MLPCHRWCSRLFDFRLRARPVHGLKLRKQQRCKSEQSIIGDPSHRDPSNNRVVLPADSSIPDRRTSTKKQLIEERRKTLVRKANPWIYPESLSKSLDAHRKANNDGFARDGIPASKSRRSRGGPARSRTDRGSAISMKVLHLPADSPSQRKATRYAGLCPPLLSEWRITNPIALRLQFPWLSGLVLRDDGNPNQSSMERLNAEIAACEEYFSPSLAETQAADGAFAQIAETILQCLGPGVRVDLIGSRAAETTGPISDLDINVRIQPDVDTGTASELTNLQLRTLDRTMRKVKFSEIIVPHAFKGKANVPIVTGTHLASGLEFQIQSTTNVYDSLQATKAFVAEFQTASVLFKMIKQMLSIRGLTTGILGGVTSYPLLNMIVTSMKLNDVQFANHDVGSQLLHFLTFWSEFSFDKHRITLKSTDLEEASSQHSIRSIDPISAIPKVVPKSANYTADAYKMSMEDPADLSNDLGKASHGIRHVQACFIEARESIRRSMQKWDNGQTEYSTEEGQPSLLAWCLGGDYTSYEEARWQLRRYADQLQAK